MSETGARREGGAADADRGGPTLRGYLSVWVLLVLLTALTVSMASLDLGAIAILVVLAIAATKSSAVLLYFMHLRWERRLVIKVLPPIVIAALAIFIGLTYTDILYR
jgi:cytochrome c oxidase subunit 4